jgi:2-keto-4-pentenoate hydratase
MTGVGEAAARLAAAADRRRPCPPVRDLLPAGDINAAYAVQTAR